MITNLTNLDARLGFVEETFAKDPVQTQLQEIRQKIAPALEAIGDLGYKQLMYQQSVPALRQAFNSRPLRAEAGISMIEILTDSEIDPQLVSAFYNRLTDVQDVSESLMKTFLDAASGNLTNQQTAKYHQKCLLLEVKRLQNRSMITHLSGLMALDYLGIEQSQLDLQLEHLQYLEPKTLDDNTELGSTLVKYLEEAEDLLSQRFDLLEDGEKLLSQALQAYKEIDKMLEIKPTDTWGQVVGKAISLRQLGRTTEALAAFDKYRDMFAETFPSAQNYTKTAQQLTLQIEELGIEGGVYIYELIDDGGAQQAGIPVGAIVIDYGGYHIQSMDDLVTTLKKIPVDEPTLITYLEMDKALIFKRQMKKIVGGSLGAGFMPI